MDYCFSFQSWQNGQVIVFGGYFRQILSIVSRGARSNIVHAIESLITLLRNLDQTEGLYNGTRLRRYELWYNCNVEVQGFTV